MDGRFTQTLITIADRVGKQSVGSADIMDEELPECTAYDTEGNRTKVPLRLCKMSWQCAVGIRAVALL